AGPGGRGGVAAPAAGPPEPGPPRADPAAHRIQGRGHLGGAPRSRLRAPIFCRWHPGRGQTVVTPIERSRPAQLETHSRPVNLARAPRCERAFRDARRRNATTSRIAFAPRAKPLPPHLLTAFSRPTENSWTKPTAGIRRASGGARWGAGAAPGPERGSGANVQAAHRSAPGVGTTLAPNRARSS